MGNDLFKVFNNKYNLCDIGVLIQPNTRMESNFAADLVTDILSVVPTINDTIFFKSMKGP
eukprot:1865963-Karenia_brevis.AAC.1